MSKATRNRTSRHIRKLIRRRWLVVSAALAALSTACARAQAPQTSYKSAGVVVMDKLLAEHITQISQKSPTFRAAWQKLQSADVPISIGTDAQLRAELPSWYRNHPGNWAGVTVAKGGEGSLNSAVVALSVSAMKQIAEDAVYTGTDYLTGELDRVLIHEIYGHLVPVVEARDMAKGCPDAVRPGESQSCVSVREAEIAAELANYRGTGDPSR